MTDATITRGAAGGRTERGERRDRMRRVSVAAPLAAVGAAAAAVTLIVVFVPGLRFAYRNEAGHAVIETAAFLVAAVAALLVGGRALRSTARTDVLLAAALGGLALSNLAFSVLPSVFDWSTQFSSWASLIGRSAGAALFAAAALVPEHRLADVGRTLRAAAATVVAATVLAGLAIALLDGSLANALDAELMPETSGRVRLEGHTGLLVTHALLIVLYAAATIGFALRARRSGDRLLLGFAIACLLAAFARVNYFLFPSIYSEWVYFGDLLRLAQYLVVLGAVGVEVLDYQRRASVAAVLDERRRVARELHDGLAQELAFIRGSATRLQRGGELDVGRVRELVSAADRAIDESRAAIAALTRPVDEPLLDALRHSAEPVAARTGARVRVEGRAGTHVDIDRRHALLRIVREATGNATRHGKAKEVVITVHADGELRVSIADAGVGFDPATDVRRDAFGLSGMRERAEALGGRLEVRSAPGQGTEIVVVLP